VGNKEFCQNDLMYVKVAQLAEVVCFLGGANLNSENVGAPTRGGEGVHVCENQSSSHTGV
jgi:hypothetical protein